MSRHLTKFLIVIFFFSTGLGNVFGQNKDEASQDSTETLVNLSDLLEQIEKANEKSKKFDAYARDTLGIESFGKSIAELDSLSERAQEQSDFFLQSYARSWLIQNLIAKWIRLNDEWEKLSVKILETTEKDEEILRDVTDLKSTWEKNETLIAKDSVGSLLQKPAAELIANLGHSEQLLRKNVKSQLRYQEKISNERNQIDSQLQTLQQLQSRDFLTFFKQDDKLLWQRTADEDQFRLDAKLIQSFRFAVSDIKEYLKVSIGKLVVLLIGGILFLVLLLRNYNQANDKNQEPPFPVTLDNISLRFPYTCIYTVTLLFALLILSNRPPLLTEILLLLFTIPLITLVVNRGRGSVKLLAISFIILYWVDFLVGFFVINNLVKNYIDLINTIIATILLLGLFKNRKLAASQFPRFPYFILRYIVPFLFALTLISFPLQLFGVTMLGRVLTTGSITFIYLAPVIIICTNVFLDLFAILQHSSFVKYSYLAKEYYHVLFTITRLSSYYLLFVTFHSSFSLTTLFQSVGEAIWNFGGQFGEFNITLGDVLEFFIILIVSWLVGIVLRVLLADEILSRANLRRGVSMAIGVVVRYTVVFLGFMLAIASTGFDLTKISILAGGLGVGIGFGLQHLVANFIAGLILIFERPIVIGDTVESEQVEGEVKQIGIRSSKIQTYDGAEVIIPNSNLINNKLSNWTLSNHSRREVITIRTSVKADPENVLTILNRIVKQHDNILDTPEPFVLFEGQLDQSLQFKIYYWVVSQMFKTRCELNLQFYRELKELGVEVPIPVHEIKSNVEDDMLKPRSSPR